MSIKTALTPFCSTWTFCGRPVARL